MRILYSHPFAVIFTICMLSLTPIQNSGAQTEFDLVFDEEITGTIPSGDTYVNYTFNAKEGDYYIFTLTRSDALSPIGLDFILPDGSTDNLTMGAEDTELVMNRFTPTTGQYTISVRGLELSRDVDFTLLAEVYAYQTERQTIGLFESRRGAIQPNGYDEYLIDLRANSPVFLVVTTPLDIFDSYIGIVDPSGQMVAANDDFYGYNSTLLYIPETTDTHLILIGGSTVDSSGPYELIVNPVPFSSAPFETDDELIIPGDMMAYEVHLSENQTYDFNVIGVDGFRPFIALTDSWMNVIADNNAYEDTTFVSIPGFTPLWDGSLFLIVMAEYPEEVGYYGVDVLIREDEEDGVYLQDGSTMGAVIGPVGDMDEYVFTAEEGKRYSILVTPTWHLLDPAIRILDENGNEVFYNDDAVDGVFSFLSNIELPAPGTYRIQLTASPDQEIQERLTGVYVISFEEGATFDQGAPHIIPEEITITPTASGAHISIPTSAVYDDTYPLSATMTADLAGQSILFELQDGLPAEFDLESEQDDLYFLQISDSSENQNLTYPIALPAPQIIATLEGSPYALAIDKNNNFFITDSDAGAIVKVALDGTVETFVEGLPTGGGTYGPNALAFDSEGNLYLANSMTNSITKIDPNGVMELVIDQLQFPADIAFDEKDRLYVAQIGNDKISRMNPNGSMEIFVSGIRNPNGLAFSPSGQLYVCDSNRGASSIYQIQEDGTPVLFVSEFAESLEGIAFDQDGYLYCADGYRGIIYRISPAGEIIELTIGISGSTDLAFGYGAYEKTLFATNMGIESAGYYAQRFIAIHTGRVGIPLPFRKTSVAGWCLY